MPKLKKITRPERIEIVKSHQNMLQQGAGGQRANFAFHDLPSEELSRFDLSIAGFYGANLQSAILTATNMTRCDLRGAYLSDAIMVNADMREGVVGWHGGNDPTYEHRNTGPFAAIAIRPTSPVP
jgi:hypothetical protein